MKSPIELGVCGLGRFGMEHCRYFSENGAHYKVAALCDIDAERARAEVAQFGGKAYSDFADFLADPDLEFVIIATRSLDHAKHAEQALQAGKIVLLEKPIGVTEADYQLLVQLDKAYPGKLYFSHNHRFEPAFENTREIIAAGLLGEIQVVKLSKYHDFMRRNDWQMRLDCGGGQLSVWGPHLLDQGLQLLGAPVRDVWSYLRRVLTPGDADDHVRIMLEAENGVVAELEISNSVAIKGPYCTIFGDRGTLIYDQAQKEIQLKYLDPEFQWPEATASEGADRRLAADENLPWVEETRAVTPSSSLWEQVEVELARHLYEAIRLDIPFPIKNSEGLEVARITGMVKQQNPQFNWIG
jgi:predicted dehydrogenase